MAASVFRNCPSCNGIHELILFSAEQFDFHATYEYTCPSTADLVSLQISEGAQSTNVKRQEAVVVREVRG